MAYGRHLEGNWRTTSSLRDRSVGNMALFNRIRRIFSDRVSQASSHRARVWDSPCFQTIHQHWEVIGSIQCDLYVDPDIYCSLWNMSLHVVSCVVSNSYIDMLWVDWWVQTFGWLCMQEGFNHCRSPEAVLSFTEGEIVSKVQVYNPVFDYVPPDLVTLFISNL